MSEGQEKLEHAHGQTQDCKQPEMSAATRQVLQRVRKMIPPMLASFHKGMYSFGDGAGSKGEVPR